jgi:hypothetical protein
MKSNVQCFISKRVDSEKGIFPSTSTVGIQFCCRVHYLHFLFLVKVTGRTKVRLVPGMASIAGNASLRSHGTQRSDKIMKLLIHFDFNIVIL